MSTPNSTQERSLILVVDDDTSMRLMLRRVMEQEGHQVIEAENGVEGLKLFQQAQPDLVLLDAMMPVLDGFEACAELQKLPGGERTPVLMITGLEDNDSVDEAFKAGATDYITKPIHWAVLRQRVRRLLASRQMEELRDDLTHMIIHDMKNPISAINGYSEILLESYKSELKPEQAEAAARIYRNSIILLDLTMMILDLKKMEEGKLSLQYSLASIPEVLQQVSDGLNWMAQNRQITLKVKVRHPDMVAVLDWDLIQRVLTNLLSNAIKHSPRNTEITLSGDFRNLPGKERCLALSVKDQGEGIAEQDQARIFEKYAQARIRRNTSRTDTGLGLTFCKLAVEAHGGTIELESKLGQGSTFTLLLPLQLEPRNSVASQAG